MWSLLWFEGGDSWVGCWDGVVEKVECDSVLISIDLPPSYLANCAFQLPQAFNDSKGTWST